MMLSGHSALSFLFLRIAHFSVAIFSMLQIPYWACSDHVLIRFFQAMTFKIFYSFRSKEGRPDSMSPALLIVTHFNIEVVNGGNFSETLLFLLFVCRFTLIIILWASPLFSFCFWACHWFSWHWGSLKVIKNLRETKFSGYSHSKRLDKKNRPKRVKI